MAGCGCHVGRVLAKGSSQTGPGRGCGTRGLLNLQGQPLRASTAFDLHAGHLLLSPSSWVIAAWVIAGSERGDSPQACPMASPNHAATPPGPERSQPLSLPSAERGGLWGEKAYVVEYSFPRGPRHRTIPTVHWGSHGTSGAGGMKVPRPWDVFPGRAHEPLCSLQAPPVEEAEGESHLVLCPQASCKGSPAATPGGGSLAVSYPPPTRSPCWPLLTVFTRTALLQFAKHFFHSL